MINSGLPIQYIKSRKGFILSNICQICHARKATKEKVFDDVICHGIHVPGVVSYCDRHSIKKVEMFWEDHCHKVALESQCCNPMIDVKKLVGV